MFQWWVHQEPVHVSVSVGVNMYPCWTKQDTDRSAYTCIVKKRRVEITSINPFVIIPFTVSKQSNIQTSCMRYRCVCDNCENLETTLKYAWFYTDIFIFKRHLAVAMGGKGRHHLRGHRDYSEKSISFA